MNIHKILFKHYEELLYLTDTQLYLLFDRIESEWEVELDIDNLIYINHRKFSATKKEIKLSYFSWMSSELHKYKHKTYKFKPGETVETVVIAAREKYADELDYTERLTHAVRQHFMLQLGRRDAYFKQAPSTNREDFEEHHPNFKYETTYFARFVNGRESWLRDLGDMSEPYIITEITRHEYENSVGEW